jgi:hypothetical protein
MYKLHGVLTRKTVMLIFMVLGTSDLIYFCGAALTATRGKRRLSG